MIDSLDGMLNDEILKTGLMDTEGGLKKDRAFIPDFLWDYYKQKIKVFLSEMLEEFVSTFQSDHETEWVTYVKA